MQLFSLSELFEKFNTNGLVRGNYIILPSKIQTHFFVRGRVNMDGTMMHHI